MVGLLGESGLKFLAPDALKRAQRASFYARRSVEARLAVDLWESTQDLSTVPAPAEWADDVFGGRKSSFTDESPTLYSPAGLGLFDDTLQQYLNAYAIAFPFSSGAGERLFSLAKILWDTPSPSKAYLPLMDQFSVTCKDGTIHGPSTSTACKTVLVQGRPVTSDQRCPPSTGGPDHYDALFSIDAVATNATPTAEGVPLQPEVIAGSDQYNFRTLEVGLNVLGKSITTIDPITKLGAIPYRLRKEATLRSWTPRSSSGASACPRPWSTPDRRESGAARLRRRWKATS